MKEMPTKERILYAALNLFAEKGYDGVGVDLIAENAGLKGPSLYRHYKGKEDILNSLIDLVAFHYEEGFGLKKKLEEFPIRLIVKAIAIDGIFFYVHIGIDSGILLVHRQIIHTSLAHIDQISHAIVIQDDMIRILFYNTTSNISYQFAISPR